MKKLIALFMSIILLMSSSLVVSAEADDIIGLDEQLDKICLNSDTNAEIREKIEESYSERLEYMVNRAMENPDIAKRKMGVELGSDDYEREQLRYMFSLDFDRGVSVNLKGADKYLLQYANSGHLSYLLSNENIFVVPGKVYDEGRFSPEGERLTGEAASIYLTPLGIYNENVINFLNNREFLKEELIKKGETTVHDVKLFGYEKITMLHIICPTNEYLVKLYDSYGEIIPEIELYTLYPAVELLNAFNDSEVKNSPYSQNLAEKILTIKNTFENEAFSLQERGLLQGNENGLDLLKPLTRIEAATMLLRAMGESTESEASVQTFSDVPQSHWGYGAAENAYSLGLIQGVGNEMFAPDEPVTSTQFATMILRAGSYEEFNWEEALDILINEGILSEEDTTAMDLFTRGDMAKIIYESMENGMF